MLFVVLLAAGDLGGAATPPPAQIPALDWQQRSDWVNVRAAGAVGDGKADDTAAIQYGGAPLLMFDCVFSEPPANNPPVRITRGGVPMILSSNVAIGLAGVVQNGSAQMVEVPSAWLEEPARVPGAANPGGARLPTGAKSAGSKLSKTGGTSLRPLKSTLAAVGSAALSSYAGDGHTGGVSGAR